VDRADPGEIDVEVAVGVGADEDLGHDLLEIVASILERPSDDDQGSESLCLIGHRVILGTTSGTVKVYTRGAALVPCAVSQEFTPTMSLTTTLIVVAGLLVLAVVLGAALVLRDPAAARRRVESLFRRPEPPARTAGDEQYYRPYWSR
jgi:hypothetical protein